jgi:YHS domain-containing protein
MSLRSLSWFLGAVALSTLAAWWRWPDSVHAIAVLKHGGGKARHPIALRPGPDSWQVVATATVLPPWRGDARISVEGEPRLDWSVALSRPVIDLGVHRFPRLDGDVLRGLEPREHVALWLTVKRPRDVDPVCGMACDASSLRADGRCFCSPGCRDEHRKHPDAPAAAPRGEYRLALRDAGTGAPLLSIPIAFAEQGRADHGAHH